MVANLIYGVGAMLFVDLRKELQINVHFLLLTSNVRACFSASNQFFAPPFSKDENLIMQFLWHLPAFILYTFGIYIKLDYNVTYFRCTSFSQLSL